MNGYNAKNYTEPGGDRTVIGGILEFGPDAEVLNFPSGGVSISGRAENQKDSTATQVAALKNDFNALLARLKDAGIMEPDSD